jgi:hypothetical protein
LGTLPRTRARSAATDGFSAMTSDFMKSRGDRPHPRQFQARLLGRRFFASEKIALAEGRMETIFTADYTDERG